MKTLGADTSIVFFTDKRVTTAIMRRKNVKPRGLEGGGGGVGLRISNDKNDCVGPKIQNPQNPLGFKQNPKKSLYQNLTPKKSHAKFPSHKNLQKLHML